MARAGEDLPLPGPRQCISFLRGMSGVGRLRSRRTASAGSFVCLGAPPAISACSLLALAVMRAPDYVVLSRFLFTLPLLAWRAYLTCISRPHTSLCVLRQPGAVTYSPGLNMGLQSRGWV